MQGSTAPAHVRHEPGQRARVFQGGYYLDLHKMLDVRSGSQVSGRLALLPRCGWGEVGAAAAVPVGTCPLVSCLLAYPACFATRGLTYLLLCPTACRFYTLAIISGS